MAPKKELPPAEGELRELKERMKKIELALEKMQGGHRPSAAPHAGGGSAGE